MSGDIYTDSYQSGYTSYEWWDATLQQWVDTETWNASGTESATIPANEYEEGAYEWSVATRDSNGQQGPYADPFSFTAQAVEFEYLTSQGIPSAESLSTPAPANQAIGIQGIASGEAFGSPATSSGAISRSVVAVPSAQDFGLPQVDQISRAPLSIGSAEALGLPKAVISASPTSISGAEAVSNPAFTLGAITRQILAISSGEVVGTPPPILQASPVLVGIASGEASGNPAITLGALSVYALSIGSGEAFGAPFIQPGEISRTVESIGSAQALGTPQPPGLSMQIPGISSQEAFGVPFVTFGPVFLTPIGLGSTEIVPGPEIQAPFTARPPPAEATADAPAPALSGVQRVAGLIHIFTPAGGGTQRVLPVVTGGRIRPVADFKALLTVRGGFMSANAQIPATEFEENPANYGVGSTWLVKDLALNKYIFGGVLDKPVTQAGVTVLTAEGWGLKADREVERWRWQARPGKWVNGLAFPFKYQHGNYDHASRILAETVMRQKDATHLARAGHEIEFWIPHDTFFKHDDANFEHQAIMVQYTPGNNHKRIAFKIDRNGRPDSDYTLDICTVDGPDISAEYATTGWTVHQSISMGSGGPDTVDVSIPTSHNLIALVLRHTGENTKERKPRKFRIHAIRVWGQRGEQENELTIDEALTDIFEFLGAATTNVEPHSFDILPYESEKSTIAQIADELSIYGGKWFWRMSATPAGLKKGEAGSYGYFKTWDVIETRQPVQFIPDEQYNKISFEYKMGDDTATKKLYATVNPFPAGYDKVYNLDVEEPTAEEAITIFAQNIIDYLSEARVTGNATLAIVRDSDTGAIKRAHAVEPGDRLRFYDDEGNLRETVVAGEVSLGDTLAEIQFTSGHPLLDKWLALRKRRLALGFRPEAATLGPLHIDEPAIPTGVTLAFDETHRSDGKRHFDAIINWTRVTKDVNGLETAIRRYEGVLQAVEDDGTTPKAGVKDIPFHVKDDNDDPDDLVATIKRIELPQGKHNIKWRAKVHAQDVQGKMSKSSGFTPAAKPSTFRPRNIDDITVDVDEHGIEFIISCDDMDEVDQDAQPKLDRSVKKFKYRYYKDGVLQSKGGRTVFETRNLRNRIKINKPRSHTWKVEAKAVDDYGNTSAAWVEDSNVKGVPPDPATPVSGDITFEDGGKEGFTARFAFDYSGAATDDDIAMVHVKWIRSASAISDVEAATAEVRHRNHISFKPGDDVEGVARWKGLRKGRHVRVAWAVEDTRGNRSDWSDWSPDKTVTRTRKPNKVTNRVATPAPRGVKTKFTPPTAYDNGEVLARDDIDRFRVTLKRSATGASGSYTVFDTIESKSDTNLFPLTKSQYDNWKDHSFKIAVDVIPFDGEEVADTDTELEAGTGASPESSGATSFSELDGTLSYNQMGSLGMSRYGTTTEMNAATAKNGDIWINTDYSPKRVYRYEGGTWNYGVGVDAIFGTIIADAVVAGAIDTYDFNAVNIEGAFISTSGSNDRIELRDDELKVFYGGNMVGWIYGSSNGIEILASEHTRFYLQNNLVHMQSNAGIQLTLGNSQISTVGPLSIGGNLIMNSNNITGVGTITATTVNPSNLAATQLTGTLNTNGQSISGIASDALKFTTRLLSATAGGQGAPPGQVAGYVRVQVEGINYKIPFYNV